MTILNLSFSGKRDKIIMLYFVIIIVKPRDILCIVLYIYVPLMVNKDFHKRNVLLYGPVITAST